MATLTITADCGTAEAVIDILAAVQDALGANANIRSGGEFVFTDPADSSRVIARGKISINNNYQHQHGTERD